MRKVKARKGTYSMQSCQPWDEIVITHNKIYFKDKASTNRKPEETIKKEIFSGKSIIPPSS